VVVVVVARASFHSNAPRWTFGGKYRIRQREEKMPRDGHDLAETALVGQPGPATSLASHIAPS